MEDARLHLPVCIAAENGEVEVDAAGVSLSLTPDNAMLLAKGLIEKAKEALEQRASANHKAN